MKVLELVHTYLSNYLREPLVFLEKKSLSQVELNDSIGIFLNQLQQGTEIKYEEFDVFSKRLNELDDDIKDIIIYIAIEICYKIYKKHQYEIEEIQNEIESSLNNSKEIPQKSANTQKYIDLINAYHLFGQTISIKKDVSLGHTFPKVISDVLKIFSFNLPLAINALTLTGQIPKANYNGVDTNLPAYPLHLEVDNETKVPIKKGIKPSQEYFPYKMVSKIAKGDTGDNTFLATNGHKVLFMRGVEKYAPEGILASKIATLISPTHFSSERLMDNGLVGSRKMTAYACSVADSRVEFAKKQYIKVDKKVFPGTGLIDEVCNFVLEIDANIENLGFSSNEIQKAHLSKIDFDHCSTSVKISKEDYEVDVVSKCAIGMYRGLEYVQHNENYIHEKLYARLKLSMITEPLLRGLADKAFMEQDQQKKEESIGECTNRSTIAFELFQEHKNAKEFIIENPNILNRCYAEIELYIKEHFEETIQPQLLSSLQTRIAYIHAELSTTMNVNIPFEAKPFEQELEDQKNTLLQQIESIILELDNRIGTTKKSPKAQISAASLLEALYSAHMQLKEDLKNKPLIVAKNNFLLSCDTAIKTHKPVLERELSLGDYLINLLKRLANAFFQICRLNPNRFFTLAQSESAKEAKTAEEKLIETIQTNLNP